MGDIYHIPNDNGKDYRLKKFVEYQHEVPSIHYRFMGEYIKKHKFELNRTIDMCWYMSCTYNEITCILLDELYQKGLSDEAIWKKYRSVLNFGSSRKYAKNMDWFIPLMKQWKVLTKNNPLEWLRMKNKPISEQTYKIIQKELRNKKYVGRFASDLFLESITYLKDYIGINIKQPSLIDWQQCSNETSGIFNIFYEDEKANLYDKKRVLTKQDIMYLTNRIVTIQNEIKKTYPEQNAEIGMFIGKICSFRNLFKNARYGGFHHDRQLEVIKNYEKDLPEFDYLWKECYDLRKEMFDKRFLGELNGWTGIRKERKKIWLTTGQTGAEK